MTNDPHLLALLATHGDQIRALLPAHLDPANPFEVRQFGNLTKYTLGPLPDGRWAHLHYLGGPDHPDMHDHPCDMESYPLVNAYWEHRLIGSRIEAILRQPGDSFLIEAATVHRIAELPQDFCWTLVFSGPVVREWRHYPELSEVAHGKYHSAASDAAYSG